MSSSFTSLRQSVIFSTVLTGSHEDIISCFLVVELASVSKGVVFGFLFKMLTSGRGFEKDWSSVSDGPPLPPEDELPPVGCDAPGVEPLFPDPVACATAARPALPARFVAAPVRVLVAEEDGVLDEPVPPDGLLEVLDGS